MKLRLIRYGQMWKRDGGYTYMKKDTRNGAVRLEKKWKAIKEVWAYSDMGHSFHEQPKNSSELH